MWNANYLSGMNAPNDTSTVNVLSTSESEGQVPADTISHTVFPTNSSQHMSAHSSLQHSSQGERLQNAIDGLQRNFPISCKQNVLVEKPITKVRPGPNITYTTTEPNTVHAVSRPSTSQGHMRVCSQSESNRNFSMYCKLNSYPEISSQHIYQGQPSVTDLMKGQSWKPINVSSCNPPLWKPINVSSCNPPLWKPINVSSCNPPLWKPINVSSSNPQRYPEISTRPLLKQQTVDLGTRLRSKALSETDSLDVQFAESGSTSGISVNGPNADTRTISATASPNRRVKYSKAGAYPQLFYQARGTQLDKRDITGSRSAYNFITALSTTSSVRQQLPEDLNRCTKSKDGTDMMHNNHSKERRGDGNTTIKTLSVLPRSDFTDLERTTTKQAGISGQHRDVIHKTGTAALITLSRCDLGSESGRMPSIQKMTSLNVNDGFDCGSRCNVDNRTDLISLDPVHKQGVPCTDRTPEESKGTTSDKTTPDKVPNLKSKDRWRIKQIKTCKERIPKKMTRRSKSSKLRAQFADAEVLPSIKLLSDFSTRCPQDLITCEVCDEKFQSAEDFNDHLAVHMAVWTAKCDYCDKRFTSQHSCDSHILTHMLGDNSFECDICHVKYKTISGFRNHKKKHHNNDETISGFRNHNKNHHNNDRTVECKDCKEEYVVGDNYKDDHAGVCIVRRRPYKCDVCDRRFNGIKWLYHHKCTPSEETDPPFVACEVCDARFRPKDLETHMVTHTDVWTTKCDYCEKRFTSQTHLDVHMLTHTGGRPFECDICHIVYRKESQWLRHNDMNHNTARRVTCMDCRERHAVGEDDDHARVCVVRRKPYKCNFCIKRFAKKRSLFNHNFKHTDPQTVACEICDARFQSPRLLEIHMSVHINVWTVKCTNCAKRFTLQKHLDEHMLTHTGKKPFECHICHISYKYKKSLNSHNNRCHAVKRVKCKICRKKYAVGDYDNHAKLYHCAPADRRPFKCDTCGRGFRKSCKLKEHMTTHSEIRSHLCYTCGQTFKSLQSLRVHSIRHSKDFCEKKIACMICGKEYGQPYMHTHMKTHGTEKKFVCEKCGRAFLLKHHLQTHEKSHLDERPYVCDICGNSFKLPHRLREHKKIHGKTVGKD